MAEHEAAQTRLAVEIAESRLALAEARALLAKVSAPKPRSVAVEVLDALRQRRSPETGKC
jgi:hypothetical protein